MHHDVNILEKEVCRRGLDPQVENRCPGGLPEAQSYGGIFSGEVPSSDGSSSYQADIKLASTVGKCVDRRDV